LLFSSTLNITILFIKVWLKDKIPWNSLFSRFKIQDSRFKCLKFFISKFFLVLSH
jgi:hypothetical protein